MKSKIVKITTAVALLATSAVAFAATSDCCVSVECCIKMLSCCF
jgi:hypothetical protein